MEQCQELFIHIGYGKTATTWLQNQVLNHNPNINYLGKTEENYPGWMIDWHYLDDIAFQRQKANIKETLNNLLMNERCNFISSEAFVNIANIYQQAKRIKDIAPFAKIIITIRNPIELIKSIYKYSVSTELFFLDLEEYLDWERTPFSLLKRKRIYLPDFFFSETIELYQCVFGKINVLVLRYEGMVNQPESFFKTLGGFVGVDFSYALNLLGVIENEGPKENQLPELRAQNFRKFLEQHFPSIAAELNYDKLRTAMDRPMMDEQLEVRLKNYFKGKSYGYF